MQRYTTVGLKKEKLGSILVAARTIPFMHSLTRFILDSGYEILHTPNAVHAIKIMNMLPVKLIFIDYNIPKGEHLELLKAMEENFGLGGIPPVIYLYDPEKNTIDEQELFRHGVRAILTMPIDFEDAKTKILQVMVNQ